MDVTLVIPCYNEQDRIGGTLERLKQFLATRAERYEVLIVNDGSRDRTSEVVRQHAADIPAVHLLDAEVNHGKGAAVRRGMLAAQGEFVIFTDADLATPLEEVPRLVEALRGAPVAIGTRIHPDGTDMRRAAQPFYRRMLGRIFSLLASLLVVRGYRDTQCGFKGFRRDAAQAIFSRQQTNGIVFDVEVLSLARVLGYAVVQVPIQWHEPGGSQMRVRAQKAAEVLRELLAIRRRMALLRREIGRG